jgi:hypothetical protein
MGQTFPDTCRLHWSFFALEFSQGHGAILFSCPAVFSFQTLQTIQYVAGWIFQDDEEMGLIVVRTHIVPCKLLSSDGAKVSPGHCMEVTP